MYLKEQTKTESEDFVICIQFFKQKLNSSKRYLVSYQPNNEFKILKHRLFVLDDNISKQILTKLFRIMSNFSQVPTKKVSKQGHKLSLLGKSESSALNFWNDQELVGGLKKT